MVSTNVIQQENKKSIGQGGLFLIFLGGLVFLIGKLGGNDATAYLGIGFFVVSVIAAWLVRISKILAAKILWAFLSPILAFVCICLFSVNQPTTVATYAYLFIGGMFFSVYTFQERTERWYMWGCIGLYFLGLMFYDRVIISNNFQNTPVATVFNENYVHFKAVQVAFFVSLVYLAMLFKNNKMDVENKLSVQIGRLQYFVSNLISSSKNKLLASGQLKDSLEEILKDVTKVINVSRASIWEFDESNYSIKLVVGMNALDNTFFYEGVLLSESHPVYFQRLLSERVICATDAINDKYTKEFKNSYLLPNGIKSLLDVPFFMDGSFKGVICLEEQRFLRPWDDIDQIFCVSISKFISIAYYSQIRQNQHQSFGGISDSLNRNIPVVEEILHHMDKINGPHPESTFSTKEKELHLKKYIQGISNGKAVAIGPMKRIVGLLQLYKSESSTENKALYLELIEKSAFEMEGILQEINSILSEKSVKERA